MRRTVVGLLSLTLASGLGVGASGSAWAHAPGSAPGALAPATARTAPDAVARGDVHDLPSPLESKRRELRQEALTDVIDGAATAQQRNGSTVVEVGRSAASHPSDKHSREATRRHQPRRHGSQYVELAREKTDKIFVILAEFGNQRHPSYPDQDTDPSTPGPGRVRRAAAQLDPRARPYGRQLDRLAGGLLRGPLPPAVLRHGPGRGVAEDVLRAAVLRAATASTVRCPDWVKVPYNEARYGRSNGFPCGSSVCSNTLEPDLGRAERVGRGPARARPYRRADHGRPAVVRPVGPQRLRRRRQLQRARRLHRPLPDRPRRRRPGRRRPVPGRGRDLVAPLVRVPGRTATTAPPTTRSAAPRSAHRHLGRRLHDAAGERRRVGVRARVRARPGPAGPLRHAGGPDNAVNWWTLMAQSRASAPGTSRDRHPPGRLRRVGQAPARLARLRGRARRDERARSARPARVQQPPRRKASSCHCRRRRS